MKNIVASLKSGDWRALLACFLYFDTGFTVWVLFGPLAPFIGKTIPMTPSQQGFLVAVPVLAAAILRVTLGNLYQSAPGKQVALLGVSLSAIPIIVLPLMSLSGMVISYPIMLVLGVFLGVGGASFAVALPMAGSNYPPRVQGLVLGLAAAGNIGAVLDGFLFPIIAQHIGWKLAVGAALPLLSISALALYFWANDLGVKTHSASRALTGFGVTVMALIGLVLLVAEGMFGSGRTGVLLLPLFGAVVAIAVLPRHYRSVLAERDTWAVMLVYSVTFGGFVGMSSYVSLLLTNLYQFSKVDAGMFMAMFASIGALVRPVGGLIADRVSGVKALRVLLAVIGAGDLLFAWTMPGPVGGIALLILLYIAFGLGNGATFQLVPHRWAGRTGLLSGIVGAAGGIGGFYLPVIMGIAKESTGSYQLGFATFGVIAGIAFLTVTVLSREWLHWSTSERIADPRQVHPVHVTE